MSDLQSLVEREDADPEMIPRIIPVESRLAIGVPTAEMVSMVARINALIPAREVVPGTSMMLVEGVSEHGVVPHIRISAWDGSHWMQVVSTGPVRVLAPGAAVMPAKKILDALRLAPERVVKLSVIGDEAVLTSGRAQWTFATPTHDSLGVYLQDELVDLHDVPAESLKRALRAVQPAASASTARAALLQAHVADGSVTATDGARMHRMAIPGLAESLSIDIPTSIVGRLIDLLSDIEGDHLIQFGANDRRIHFHIGRARVISQRILLPFPDIESILVGTGISAVRSVVVSAEELRSAVKRVRINADPDRAAVSLAVRELGSGEWILAIHSRDHSNNFAQEVIDAQWNGSRPQEFVVNHKFLADILSQISDDYVTIRVGEDTKTNKTPLLIEEGGFRAILSQIRMY